MAYEIPTQLEYKEKILFGLTFEQIFYSLIFLPPALLILFKAPIPEFLRWMISTLVACVGILFMFCDFKQFLANWYVYLQLQNVDATSKRMTQFLEVQHINKGILKTKKNQLAFLKVEPINFRIRTNQEQEVIIKNFKKFLNSLDFPIQILMDTVPIKIENYLDALETRTTDNFEKQFAAYKQHLSGVLTNSKVMNRNFYVIIPEKDNLDIQVSICKDRLKQMNLQVTRLHDSQISELVAKFFEGDKRTFCPDSIRNKPNQLQINNTHSRIIAAVGYPRLVEAGFLDKIVTTNGDFDLSLHIGPFDVEQLMITLNKELQKQRADLYAAKINGTINPSLEIKYKDTRKTLEELQKGSDKLFHISLYINCRAKTQEELEYLTRKIKAELNSLMILPKIPLFCMIPGLKSVAPLGHDQLNYKRNITANALSAFFPFTSPFLQTDEQGVWFGQNKNNIPIIRDVFGLSNPNGCILATSGSGKSYLAKLLISRHILNGTKVMVIDPQAEYTDLIKKFNGEVISLHRTSKTMINPLDLMGHDYAQKRLSLVDLLQIMLGELTEPQKSILDKSLTNTYEKKGITADKKTWNNEPPKLEHLLQELKTIEKKATSIEKTTIRSLINRLSMYVDGVFSFLNKDTNMNVKNDIVCFNIGDMPKQVKPVLMFLILDFVYMQMKTDIERKLLVIDEAWALLERSEEESYIFEIVKTCRKFNLGLLLINQEVEGLLSSKAGKSVLANSSYTILMRQRPSVIKNIQQSFDLSETECNYLLTASVGTGILIVENDHSELRIIASPQEHKLITTNADEKLQNLKPETIRKETKKDTDNRPSVNITVDKDVGFFPKHNLTPHEVNYLLTKGYKQVKLTSIITNRKEYFLLKPRYNESLIHHFTTMEIHNFLKEHTKKINMYYTKKPDIICELHGKNIAIEIETGSWLRIDKRKIQHKAQDLSKNYDEGFFVITNKNVQSKYTKYGPCYNRLTISNKLRKLVQNRPDKKSRFKPLRTKKMPISTLSRPPAIKHLEQENMLNTTRRKKP